ncbi:MAG: imm11 family protein [Chloroflexota bacterium]
MNTKWFDIYPKSIDIGGRLSPSGAEFFGTSADALKEGQFVQHWNPSAYYFCRSPEEDGWPDDVLYEHLGVEVYSKRLVAALNAAGIADFQYLPVHVRLTTGSEVGHYLIANPIRRVAALDLARSDFDRFGDDWPEGKRGKIWSIRKAVLHAEALRPYDCIRLDECLSNLFVSERVREVFLDLGVESCVFSEVELT